jgi:16S rRNA G966 N2-methylase RsmD
MSKWSNQLVRYFFSRTARIPGFEVEHNQFLRTIRTIFVNIKYRGLSPTILGILAKVSSKLQIPGMQRYMFQEHGTAYAWLDTGGIVEVENLDLSDEKKLSATRYEAASEYEFRDVLERLKIPYNEYNFIDYGSGKGAILATAATYPFKSVVGVEHSFMLHEIAQKNIEELKRRQIVASHDLDAVHGDATTYRLPVEPHILYLYNSFDADILASVVDRITVDLADIRGPNYFLYNNPMHHEVLDGNDKFQKISSPFGGKWMVYSINP